MYLIPKATPDLLSGGEDWVIINSFVSHSRAAPWPAKVTLRFSRQSNRVVHRTGLKSPS